MINAESEVIFMGWRNIIITQHSKLQYSNEMMVVQTMDGINQIPLTDISLLVIETTQAVITSALMSQLARQQINVLFIDENHQPCSQAIPLYAPNGDYSKLHKQAQWQQDTCDRLWTQIVAAKITNQAHVLTNYHYSTEKLSDCINQLEVGDSSNQEAIAARYYFQTLFGDGFHRRHNDNAVNAALNYGYTILLATVNREIVQAGYQTYTGIHHVSLQNYYNLGCDLMEPFRPVIDYWVKAHEKITTLTPDIRYGLVECLNTKIKYQNKNCYLTDVIRDFVRDCLSAMDEPKMVEGVFDFVDEVPNNAIDDNV